MLLAIICINFILRAHTRNPRAQRMSARENSAPPIPIAYTAWLLLAPTDAN